MVPEPKPSPLGAVDRVRYMDCGEALGKVVSGEDNQNVIDKTGLP